MTEEEAKERAVLVATEVLDGRMNILLGARELNSLRSRLDVPEFDPDFLPFLVIDSECDCLPLGEVRKYWSPQALLERDLEIVRAEEWAREFAVEALRNVVKRFAKSSLSGGGAV